MPSDDESSQRIEALEQKVARLEQALQRMSVQQALMDDRLLTLERNRLFNWWNRLYRSAANLYARIGWDPNYGGLSDLRQPDDYQRWVNREQNALDREDHRAIAAAWRSHPLISVMLTAGEGASSSLASVFAQCYGNWQLCLPPQLMSTLRDQIAEADAMPRTCMVEHRSEVTGDYLLTLNAGDRLSPHALYFYAQAHQDDPSAILYSDEDVISSEGVRRDPIFKPGWSPELLRSTMYVGRSIVYPRASAASLSSTSQVWHIPRVLYHRGASTIAEQSVPAYSAPPGSRLSLIVCSRDVRQVQECLKAVRTTAKMPLEILVVHHLESGGDEKMRRVVEGFGGMWIPYRGPFDFARMNNLAAAKATASHLLFMNDDVVVQQPGWDEALAATLARPEVGIAGAMLHYPNGTIQHAGVVVGMGDAAGHCGRFQMTSQLWPWLHMSRDVTAVTGAMFAIRSELFEQMHGFDEAFPVNYNDVDLCLRVRKAGLRVVCLNVGKVIHRESQTRVGGTRYEEREALYQRWAEVLAKPDEFYSPHLAPTERIALNCGDSPLTMLTAGRTATR